MNRKDKLKEALSQKKALLFDGALGTELIARGLQRGECPERWNLNHPEKICDIAKDYADAGADVISTNSFGANSIKLASYELTEKAGEISKLSAQLVRQAVGTDKLIAGSIGPTGAFLAPLGSLSRDEAFIVFSAQAKALSEGGADLILIETMTAIEEALVALQAAKSVCDIPIGVTMTFDPTPRGWFTIMGVSIIQAVETLAEADFLGTNCGNGMEGLVTIIREMSQNTNLPLLASANAGIPRLVNGETFYPETAEEMLTFFDALLDAGATFIGGCCGTTPATIRAFSNKLKCGDTL